ncbi:MAG: PIN domain-containing protein [Defluviicoccus sp.]|nr:PIN domain-containing protein [Defluviicoccus sp.]MDE0383719.1 PIN domain-containing protein [Defluviicoccus sp.]
MIALDTNILIYAHRGESQLHEAAASRLVILAEGAERWALPVFCVTEFLRVVTHPRVFNPASSVAQATAFVERIASAPSCEIVRPGAEFLEILIDTARRAEARGNLMFDAQIAALCLEHGIDTVLTNDRDFDRFEPLRAIRLE